MKLENKNRTDLRSYFVKNSIPREDHFADLIDGMLNQKEDGIFKLSSRDPLSIVATGDANSQQKLINFYQNLGDADSAWMLNLSPQGFSISDGQGMSRLFIDRNTGNVGIGTTSPENAESWNKVLDILGAGHAKFSMRTANIEARFFVHDGGWWTAPAGMGIGTQTAHPLSFSTHATPRMTIDTAGNVGIGTTDPKAKLDVNGGLKVAGNITWGNNSVLSVDQGGSIELGGSPSGVGTPYIDFHYKDKVEDFNVRIINDADRQLTLAAPLVNVVGQIMIEHWSVPLNFRETDCDVDKGGLWRMPLDGGVLRFDVNTGASGQEFGSNYLTPLAMTKEGNVVLGAKSTYWDHNPYSDVIGPPVASIGRLEVGGYSDGSNKVPAVLRIHQWGTGSAEFYKPQGQILYLRETPGGGGNWFNTLEVSGNVNITGKLTVQGAQQNIIKVVTVTKAVINAGVDVPANWSISYSGFSQIYTVFAVLQGFSIFGNGNTKFDNWGHIPALEGIIQHVFLRVDEFDTTTAKGVAYCSEAGKGEVDNSILFTVVVMGRGNQP